MRASDDFGVSGSFTVVSDRLTVVEENQCGEWVDAQPSGRLDRRRFDELNSVAFGVVVDVLKPVECHFARFTAALLIFFLKWKQRKNTIYSCAPISQFALDVTVNK